MVLPRGGKKSTGNLLKFVIAPVIGASILAGLFIKAIVDFADPEQSYSGEFLGVGPPLIIGLGAIVLAFVGAVLWRRKNPQYFASRTEVAPARRRAGQRRGRSARVRVVAITQHGRPEVLQVQERPDCTPGPGRSASPCAPRA